MLRLLFIVFSFCYLYAFLRYHIAKDIPYTDWLFILNKAFAWTSVSAMSLSTLPVAALNKFKVTKRQLGIATFLLATVHLTCVLILFGPEYYPKLYSENELNLIGWSSILTASTAMLFYFILFLAVIMKVNEASQLFKYGKIALLVNILHPILIGFSSWFSPNEWPFYLPPITMLATIGVFIVFLIRKLN